MPAVKDVGEPCEGEPHARIDGGWEETNVSRLSRAAPGASRLPDRPQSDRPVFVDESAEAVAPLHVA